ncbi:MAG: hypothetical protein AAFN10_29005, partial [Bacteroidota bacterium]
MLPAAPNAQSAPSLTYSEEYLYFPREVSLLDPYGNHHTIKSIKQKHIMRHLSLFVFLSLFSLSLIFA